MDLFFVALGLVAGVLTTVAGMGGGLFLIAVIGMLKGPHLALVLTSPALFVSNVHRTFMYRREVDWRVAGMVAAGALPGALLGGLVLPAIPDLVITSLLVVTTTLALLRAKGVFRLAPQGGSLVGAGAGIGALASTSGGAGLLLSPVLLATGLTGAAFVATTSACSVAMHFGRISGYAGSGLLTRDLARPIVALLVGLLAGNLLGKRLRTQIPEGSETKVELGALVVSTALAVLGIAR